jgi:hypothetical protein
VNSENKEPNRKKSFWEMWFDHISGERTVSIILSISLGLTLTIISISAGIAMMMHKFELTGIIADMLTTVLGAIVGALSVYLGMKGKNGNAKP